MKKLKGGERLASPIRASGDQILIPSGAELKPEYIDLLVFLGIESVSVEDSCDSEGSPRQPAERERMEEYASRARRILEHHVYTKRDALRTLQPLATEIVDGIEKESEDMVLDIEEREGDLYTHTINVTVLSVLIARRLRLSKEDQYSIALGCLLHDLGLRYITVPYINHDMEKRTPSEFTEYKKHTILGYSALEKETWIGSLPKKMILLHHERMNGTGFPLHQKSKELCCNIIQASDAFDSYITGVESRRVGITRSIGYLIEQSDILFDPRIVKILEEVVARYPVGTRVRLSTGELGVVTSQTGNPIRPEVSVPGGEGRAPARYDLDREEGISILQAEG